jgi:hypothetical protein
MPTPAACIEAAVLINELARSVGRLPKNSGTTAGSKKVPPLRLACVQRPKGPGFRGPNSVGAESRTRFLTGPSGKSEAYIAHSVPPWDWPKRPTPPGPGGLDDLLDRAVHIVQDEVLQRQPRVLGAGDPEVQHKDVEPLADQVLDQAVARHEV